MHKVILVNDSQSPQK